MYFAVGRAAVTSNNRLIVFVAHECDRVHDVCHRRLNTVSSRQDFEGKRNVGARKVGN